MTTRVRHKPKGISHRGKNRPKVTTDAQQCRISVSSSFVSSLFTLLILHWSYNYQDNNITNFKKLKKEKSALSWQNTASAKTKQNQNKCKQTNKQMSLSRRQVVVFWSTEKSFRWETIYKQFCKLSRFFLSIFYFYFLMCCIYLFVPLQRWCD